MSSRPTPISDALYDYVVAQRSNADDPVMEELQRETRALGEIGRMAISLDQASLIGVLVALLQVKSAVEIGTFTGTSSIAIARNMPSNGKLICFEQDFKYISIARRYWIKANVQDKIDLRLGDAHRLLPHYKPRELIDFVFIDADKESYDFYFETILPFVRPGGLILFDNMLMGGGVIDPGEKRNLTIQAIDRLNRKLSTDTRVQSVLVPIADGLTLCRKLWMAGLDGRRMIETR
jgi:caffeoyl-CoA O-methyltransferase